MQLYVHHFCGHYVFLPMFFNKTIFNWLLPKRWRLPTAELEEVSTSVRVIARLLWTVHLDFSQEVGVMGYFTPEAPPPPRFPCVAPGLCALFKGGSHAVLLPLLVLPLLMLQLLLLAPRGGQSEWGHTCLAGCRSLLQSLLCHCCYCCCQGFDEVIQALPAAAGMSNLLLDLAARTSGCLGVLVEAFPNKEAVLVDHLKALEALINR
jgi:hypothetical protein